MAELDAKLGLARRLGEAPPAAAPWTVERAAQKRLNSEFPRGELQPCAKIRAQPSAPTFDQLDAIDSVAKARMADDVAIEIEREPPTLRQA